MDTIRPSNGRTSYAPERNHTSAGITSRKLLVLQSPRRLRFALREAAKAASVWMMLSPRYLSLIKSAAGCFGTFWGYELWSGLSEHFGYSGMFFHSTNSEWSLDGCLFTSNNGYLALSKNRLPQFVSNCQSWYFPIQIVITYRNTPFSDTSISTHTYPAKQILLVCFIVRFLSQQIFFRTFPDFNYA